jgi:hypothetical protein
LLGYLDPRVKTAEDGKVDWVISPRAIFGSPPLISIHHRTLPYASIATVSTCTVTVTNPDRQTATLLNAFTVNQAPPSHLSTFTSNLAQPMPTQLGQSGPAILPVAPGELHLRPRMPSRVLCQRLLIKRSISQNAMEI